MANVKSIIRGAESSTTFYYLSEWLDIIKPEWKQWGKHLPEGFKNKIRATLGLKRWTRSLGGDQKWLFNAELTDLGKACDLPPFLFLINPKKLNPTQIVETLRFAADYMYKLNQTINPSVLAILDEDEADYEVVDMNQMKAIILGKI